MKVYWRVIINVYNWPTEGFTINNMAEEYLVASVDDLKNEEMYHVNNIRKEVVVGSGKALLSKVNGEYFATSHLCPHYKAPLSKGVLSSDGRLMCPWHGACFRVQTGDIEDAPSIDGLASYKVTIRDDKVYVKVKANGN